MANRKNESAASLAPALKALLLCAFFVTSGVGYVWYKSQINVLGREIARLEMRLEELKRGNKIRQDRFSALCAYGELDTRAKKMNLGLGMPAVTQVVHLPEPASTPAAVTGNGRPAGTGRSEGVEE